MAAPGATSPLPWGEVGAKRRVRGYAFSVWRDLATPILLPLSPPPSPRGRGGGPSPVNGLHVTHRRGGRGSTMSSRFFTGDNRFGGAPGGVNGTLPKTAPLERRLAELSGDDNKLHKQELVDAKVRLHRKLIDDLNLPMLERLSREELREIGRAHV